MKYVAITNNKQLIIMKNNAFFGFIIPDGISLIAVRGFKASNFLSTKRLKAIAELRAVIIHNNTNANSFASNV